MTKDQAIEIADNWLHRSGWEGRTDVEDAVRQFAIERPYTLTADAALDTCILTKGSGPWWNRRKAVDTVICGRNQAERYLRAGYSYDWEATTRARVPAVESEGACLAAPQTVAGFTVVVEEKPHD